MDRRIDTYRALVPDIKWATNPIKPQTVVNARRAAKQAKLEEQREVAKKPMTSWLAGQKLPPVRTIPFRKTKSEEARLEKMGALLSRFLPPCGSLCISPKDAQEHFALSAKDLESVPGCNQKKGKQELAVSRRIFALEDVHTVARRLHKDETGLRAARVAWREARAQQQAETEQRRARQADVAAQRKKKLLSLLPEHPLRDPKKGLFGYSDLDSWVLDEAVAAYTGTVASLQAALDIYKRNFFLASECFLFRATLEALRMDVMYHKKQQRSTAKNQPERLQPHCIGLTEPELRAAAEKEALWVLGYQIGFRQVAPGPHSAAVIRRVHATAFQRVLDMPTLASIFKNQVAQAMSEPIEQRLKESKTISAIRDRCSSQHMADMLHSQGCLKHGPRWKEFVGDAQLFYDCPSDNDYF